MRKIREADMKKLLKTKDISNIIGCGQKKAYQIMHLKAFPSIQIGKNWYVEEEKFQKWLNSYAYRACKL